MQHRFLPFLSLIFVGLVVFQSALGGVLFLQNVGSDTASISRYYADKSFHGLLEVTLPHTLFIAVALMASLHFLYFIPTLTVLAKRFITHLLFIVFTIDQLSVFLIVQGQHWISYLKLGAFFLFESLLAALWIFLFIQILKGIND